jgi:hypothetical protein
MSQTERHFLPKEVLEGLERARARDQKKTGGTLRVQVGDSWYPILSYDERGFEVALDVAPKLRGLVEIHDGPRHIRTALIMAIEAEDGAMRYRFKRTTKPRLRAPVDYELMGDLPVGYLTAQ